MTTENLSNLLLHYGRITSDINFEEKIGDKTYYTRVRTYIYNNRHFYHLMVNGEVNECFELK